MKIAPIQGDRWLINRFFLKELLFRWFECKKFRLPKCTWRGIIYLFLLNDTHFIQLIKTKLRFVPHRIKSFWKFTHTFVSRTLIINVLFVLLIVEVDLIVFHNNIHILLHTLKILSNCKKLNNIFLINYTIIVTIIDFESYSLCCFEWYIEDSLNWFATLF